MADIPLLGESDGAREALSRARILYTDLDGTLLGRGGSVLALADGTPSLAAAEAVLDLGRAGLDVMPVSGRTVPMLAEITRMLSWNDYVAELGAILVYGRGDEVVYDLGEWDPRIIPVGSTPYEVIEEAGAIQALMDAFPGRIEYHAPYHVGRDATHLLRGHVDPGEARAVLADMDPPVTFLDNGVIHPRAHTLQGVETVHAYHVMPKGTSKTRAIEHDLARRGLTAEDAVMIGDALADMDAHPAVGLVVLVGNALASPAVSEKAPSVGNLVLTEGHTGEGWAELAHAWIEARGLA